MKNRNAHAYVKINCCNSRWSGSRMDTAAN